MEEKGSINTQADFLDLRKTLAEQAGGVFSLICAIALTLYAAVRAAALALAGKQLGTFGLVFGGIWLLALLISAVGLWIMYFKGRGESFCDKAAKLVRVTPVIESVLGVLACIVAVAALIVVLFSNSMVSASLSQLSQELAGGYFTFTSRALAFLSNLTFSLIIAACVTAALIIGLLTLRYILLSAFIKKLCKMSEKNEPMKNGAGLSAFLSYFYGCMFALWGSAVCRTNLTAGLSLCLYGLALFCEGLLLHKTARELSFLNTYYAKLNRSVARRAQAIRAQKEALMNAPLAIPASTEEEKHESIDDIPGGDEAPDVIVPPFPPEEPGPDVIVAKAEEETKEETNIGKEVNNEQKEDESASQNEDISV